MRLRHILTLLIIPLVLCFAACAPKPTATAIPTPVPGVVVFTPSSAEVLNPERGFFSGIEFYGTKDELDDSEFFVRQTGDTLAFFSIRLDHYRTADIPLEFLNGLDNFFEMARKAGIKHIVRVSYNAGPTPNSEPDASLAQALRHIKQLAPNFEKNKDVIVWFEAGFIGAWGEWHTSTNALDMAENKALIRDALFTSYPKDRAILFRYPGDIISWYPQPLSEEQAFTQSDQARLGHHNDCFLASDDDWGTYSSPPDYEVNMRADWQTYLSEITRFTPMSGETCNLNPPRSNCETALNEMELMHWSAINDQWHPDVIQVWKIQGCYPEIRNRLGYRLSLLETRFTPKVRPGSVLSVHVTLQNTGFASPLLPRPVYLLLVNQAGSPIYQQSVAADPRGWEFGEHSFSVTLAVPANLPAGEYQLALWLPDPAETLQNDPRYAIQFANDNVWVEKMGWNTIGKVTVINGE